MSGAAADAPPPAALTADEAQEFAELRRQNQVLRAENAVLQRRLEEERSQRRQGPEGDNHYRVEAKVCRAAITDMDANAQLLGLYDELRRLRRKCDVYAEAVEESRSYFFEMKRLYTEVAPHLRSTGGSPAAAAAPASGEGAA